MKIAVNAADLDHSRIDGTRIYIQNLLKNFGRLDQDDRFLIYHKNKFNPQLKFPEFPNYEIKKYPFPFWWTQTRFAWEILKDMPNVLFMPMHSLPFFRSKKTRTVVTIHDLAFKFFPDHFAKKDLRRLNFFTDYAVKHADKLIAISNSTKKDILKLYPKISEDKIKVIYHGYDKDLFHSHILPSEIIKTNTQYKIHNTKYIVFVGAIQPRKNIETLLEAFKFLKKEEKFRDLGLVIAGSPGWLADEIVKKIKKIPDTVMTGKFETEDLATILAKAEIFVLPSLYEGFGLPILEAMACGVPVIAADNSSLGEVVGNAGQLFQSKNAKQLAEILQKTLEDENLRNKFRRIGFEWVKNFSWEKCAKETLVWLKDA